MSRLSNFLSMLRERRVGFKMRETMTGDHEFEPGYGPDGTFPMEFRAIWGPDYVSDWINPSNPSFLKQPMEGKVDIGGLCEDQLFSGTLELLYFSSAKIRYRFDFEIDNITYHYAGEKRNLRLWNFHRTHTTLYGRLTEKESGRLVSTSILHFQWSNILPFLMSFQFA